MNKTPRRELANRKERAQKLPTAFLRRGQKRRKRRSILQRFKPEQRAHIKRSLIILLIIFVIGGVSYMVFFSKTLIIKNTITIQDEIVIQNADLANTLSGFRGQRLFFLKTDTTIKEILDTHPEIAAAVIRTKLPNTIILDITSYPKQANIINKTPEGSKKFIVNVNGLTIAEGKQDLTLPYIIIDTTEPLRLNTQILEKEQLEFMVTSSEVFRELFDMEIKEIMYKKTEREVHLKTARDFLVWLDIEKDLNQQLEKLKTVLPNLNIYDAQLEYIDLRISGVSGEKVIYK